MEKILLIGKDFGLLSSRAAVLAKTKAAVTCCYPNEVSTLLGSNANMNLVVLCHSLPADVRAGIIKDIRVKWPQAQVLQVLTDLYETSGYDVDAMAESDPPKLIEQVRELLSASSAQRKVLNRPEA
jgi:hypothetical protein